VITERIYVKGQKEPVVKEVVITRHGPIISNVVKGLARPLSLRWTAYDRTEEFEAILGFMRAQNWDDFKKALEHFMAPAQNFVFADIDGNIAYRANGLFPIRKKGDGLLPVPGWTDEYEWKGYIPWDQVPQVVNPAEGFIVTANNKVVGDDYPYFLSHQWALPYRAMSIRQELGGKKGLTLAHMELIQNDWKNLQARTLYPVIGPALERAQWSPIEEKARQVLARWAADPRDRPEAAGPAIFHALYLKMLFRTFHDELGDNLYQRFLADGSPMNILEAMLQEGGGATGKPESPWFDDVTTPARETREESIRLAFKDAVADLAGRLGSDPEGWAWGKLHTITFDHPLGKVKPLNLIFDRGPFPYGGSKITAGAASYSLSSPFAVTSAGPWRYAVDLADLNHGQDVLAIGASGQPASPHYQDQMDLWLTGRYKTMWFDDKEIKSPFAGKKTVLKPRTPAQ
ncbi:MAG: penicillin acylase family protein, partial [Firmicutes bacterium]|nr:penicillin acylase family protein [Bacillota bacterium]